MAPTIFPDMKIIQTYWRFLHRWFFAFEQVDRKISDISRLMLHKFKALCITFTVFILLSQISDPVFSQGSHIRFKRLTINDGLSLSSVYCIFQDSKGFMWFGTEDGLNKYDGNNFAIYRADPTGNSGLSYKWTEIILEDSRGKLWLGSRGGLSQFDPETEPIENFSFISCKSNHHLDLALDFSENHELDSSGVWTILELLESANQQESYKIYLIGLQPFQEKLMEKGGVFKVIGKDRVFKNATELVESLSKV